jgi:hypothetical protein
MTFCIKLDNQGQDQDPLYLIVNNTDFMSGDWAIIKERYLPEMTPEQENQLLMILLNKQRVSFECKKGTRKMRCSLYTNHGLYRDIIALSSGKVQNLAEFFKRKCSITEV